MFNVKPKVAQIQATPDDSRSISHNESRSQAMLRRGGLHYTALYSARWFLRQLMEYFDRRLVRIEQKKRLVEPWTISARRFTADENKRLWNEHDWSSLGEEWTRSAEWKERIIREFLIPYVPEGTTVLEIGPGGGRWSDLLQRRARRLIVVDVAERAIALCRERFASYSHIEYLVGDGRTINVADESIDVIWSYDVFVHINPPDARAYFHEFRRILRPGGHGLIHHAGPPLPHQDRKVGWRSDLTDVMVREFIQENGLKLVCQFQSELVNKEDSLTVFEKPASSNSSPSPSLSRCGVSGQAPSGAA